MEKRRKEKLQEKMKEEDREESEFQVLGYTKRIRDPYIKLTNLDRNSQ